MIVHVAAHAVWPLHRQQHALLHRLRGACTQLLGLRIEVDDAAGADAEQAQQQREKCAKRSHYDLKLSPVVSFLDSLRRCPLCD